LSESPIGDFSEFPGKRIPTAANLIAAIAMKRSDVLASKAHTLAQAWLELAPPALRRAYEASPAGLNAVTSAFAGMGDRPNWFGVVGAITSGVKAESKRMDLERRMREALAERIANHEFELLGRRLQPTKSRGFVIIKDVDLRRYPPDWNAGTLAIKRKSYFDLRVSRKAARATGIKRGRRGSSDIIRDAISELDGDPNCDICGVPRKIATKLILQRLRPGNAKGKTPIGYSDGNIQKLISHYCRSRNCN
jgi:hypothetical protein